MLTETSSADVSEQEKLAALDFALKSESLSRSERLKCLLSYIREAELTGKADQLTEYDIAISALGRRSDFSPIEDSAVRSRTYELRQKLEKLYAVEAPGCPRHRGVVDPFAGLQLSRSIEEGGIVLLQN